MIKTISDFLEKLSAIEAKKLDEFNIKHTVTIGNMYEGLTKDILSQALPSELDLKIVDGFIHDGFGTQSGQIDCMLVTGSGEEIPHTSSFLWHVKDVIAVFEVKKSLYNSDMIDAFEHLKSVSEIHNSYTQNTKSPIIIDAGPSFRNFSQITGKTVSSVSENNLPPNDSIILNDIIFDQVAPARIILGYGGFKTEKSLRDKFTSFLQTHQREYGYGIRSLPNLITANGNSIIKLNGHPYHTQIREDGFWPICGSYSQNSISLILEIIWTKISYIQSIPEYFGEDLEIEVFNLLLSGKPHKDEVEKKWGWEFESTEASQTLLDGTKKTSEWEPIFLSNSQHIVILQLGKNGSLNILDNDFREFLAENNESSEDFIAKLVNTTLVSLDQNQLSLTTLNCNIVLLPDGRVAAAENSTGRLTRWAQKFMDDFEC